MHRHYLGLFRRAKSMLMAGCPVSDVLFSLYARRHLGKSQGRKMKVRGIANIQPQTVVHEYQRTALNGGRFSSFLLIISKHGNTLQLNGFICRKVCDYHSLAAIKLNEIVLNLAKSPSSVKEERTRSLYFLKRNGSVGCMCFLPHIIFKSLVGAGGINAGEASLHRISATAVSLLSFALAGYCLGNA